jgi:hypothetical protein
MIMKLKAGAKAQGGCRASEEKSKVVPVYLIMHHAMKKCGSVEV